MSARRMTFAPCKALPRGDRFRLYCTTVRRRFRHPANAFSLVIYTLTYHYYIICYILRFFIKILRHGQ